MGDNGNRMIIDKCRNIYDFLVEIGGPYPGMDQNYLQEVITFCVMAKQYLWEPGRYAVLFFFIEAHDVPAILKKQIPRNITSGPVLYVAEIACKEGMKEAWGKLKQYPWDELVAHSTRRDHVRTYLRKGV